MSRTYRHLAPRQAEYAAARCIMRFTSPAEAPRTPRRQRRANALHGFTLIELLVVIAIISLLVSILLPSLGRAKALARSAVCSSNLRNIGTAFGLFTSENKGWSPPLATPMRYFGGRRQGPYWYSQDYLFLYLSPDFYDKAIDHGYPGSLAAMSDPEGNYLQVASGEMLHQWGPSGLVDNHERSILNCPSSVSAVPDVSVDGSTYQDYNPIANGLTSYLPWDSDNLRKANLHAYQRQSDQRILFMDCGGSNIALADTARWSTGIDRHPMPGNYTVMNAGPDSWGLKSAGHALTRRHLDGANALYLTGQVNHLPAIQEPNSLFWGYYNNLGSPYAWND